MCCQHQIVFLHNVRLFDRVNLSCIYVICFYIQLFMLCIVVFVSKPLLVCHVAHQRTWMRHAGCCTRFIGTLDRVALCFFPKTSWTSGWLKVSQVNDFNAAILFPQNTTTWYVFINYQLNLDIMFFHHVFLDDLQTFRPKRGPVFAGKWLGENSSLLGDPLELEVYGIARK